MAIRATTPKQKVAEKINISYEKAFSQAENGVANVVPILIKAWSDDSRTGNGDWSERWDEGETPCSKHAGEEYGEFSKKILSSFYYIGAKHALPYIFKELKNFDKFKRKEAKRVVQLLISYSIINEACLPVVSKALKDRNADVRHMAAVIASCRPDWFIPALEKLLKDKNKIVRYEAAFGLAKLHKTSPKPILLLALKDKNPQIRQEALCSLALIGKQDPQVTTKIMRLLEDEDIYVIGAAINVLGVIGDKKATMRLVKFLNVKYPNLQLEAITALNEIGDKTAIPHLKHRLESITTDSIEGPVGGESFVKIPAKEFRQKIGMALCSSGDKDGIDIIKGSIWESSGWEREKMINAVGNVKNPSAIPVLTQILLSKDTWGRQLAMEGLAKIGTASIPAFQKGAQSKDTEIQQLSIQGLGRLKDKASANILSNLLVNKNLQYLAISALVNIGTLSIPVLIRKLTDKNIEIQTASIIALGRIGDKSVVPELINKLQSAYPQIRLQAIVALGNIKDKSAAPILVKLLKTKDITMKYALLKALGQTCLGQIDTKEAIDALVDALKDEQTKIESAKILCEIGNREGVLVLLKAIKQRTINPKDVLFLLAKSKDKEAIVYLKERYYPTNLIRTGDRKPNLESAKPHKPVATFESQKGVTFSIFNWFIYGSNDDIWLNYSKDKKQWSPPIFTGLTSAPKRTGRSVTPLEFKVRIEGDKLIFEGKVKESGPFNDEKMRQWQEITTLQRLTQDTDKDELTDIEESRFMTNPKKKDTDNDGLLDGIDINPLVGRVKTDDGKLIRQAVFAYHLRGGYLPLVIVMVNEISQKQEFLGLEGMVLCLTPIELAKFRENIGYGIPIYSFGEIKYDKTKEKAEVEFATFVQPKSGHGVIFKLEKVCGVWVVIDQGPLWKS